MGFFINIETTFYGDTNMGFREFLIESEREDLFDEIKQSIEEMDEDYINEFGYFLVDNFLDLLGDEDEDDEFYTIDDVTDMLSIIDPEFYEDILDELGEVDDVSEAVSRMLKTSNRNRKPRKFMANTKSDMRKTKADRKRYARKNRMNAKRYYKANKNKIKQYQKSRRDAIKKGKHKVKVRKNS